MTDPCKVVERWLKQVRQGGFSYSDRPDKQPVAVKKFNNINLDSTAEKLINSIYKWCHGEVKTKPRFNDVVICLVQYVNRNNNYANQLVPHIPALDDLNFIWDRKSRIYVTDGDPVNSMAINSNQIRDWYEHFSEYEGDFAKLADDVITDCIVTPSTLKLAKASALMVVLNERKF